MVVLLSGTLFVFYLNGLIIYSVLGYDASIIGSGTVESMRAVRETLLAQRAGFFTVFGLTIICTALSAYTLYKRGLSASWLPAVSFVLGLFLAALYLAAALSAYIIPSRVV